MKDSTYTIQVVGEQSKTIAWAHVGVPAERLEEISAVIREHGPKVAALTAAARASAAFTDAMGAVIQAFERTPPRRRRVGRK